MLVYTGKVGYNVHLMRRFFTILPGKRLMKKIIIAVTLLCLAALPCMADTFLLKNGERIEGRIEAETEDYFIVVTKDDAEVKILKDNLEKHLTIEDMIRENKVPGLEDVGKDLPDPVTEKKRAEKEDILKKEVIEKENPELTRERIEAEARKAAMEAEEARKKAEAAKKEGTEETEEPITGTESATSRKLKEKTDKFTPSVRAERTETILQNVGTNLKTMGLYAAVLLALQLMFLLLVSEIAGYEGRGLFGSFILALVGSLVFGALSFLLIQSGSMTSHKDAMTIGFIAGSIIVLFLSGKVFKVHFYEWTLFLVLLTVETVGAIFLIRYMISTGSFI